MKEFVLTILLLSIRCREIYSISICDIVPRSDISQNPDEVKFFLYSNKTNVNSSEELAYQNLDALDQSSFDSSKNLIVLIHGFIQNYTSDFPVVVKNAYLNKGYAETSNIITVDWGKLAGAYASSIPIPLLSTLDDLPLYGCAVENVPIVGKRIADFLIFLIQNQKTACNKIHIVGQSLGAHVSGIVGKNFNETNCKIDRITGTDPAAPLFFGNILNQHNILSKTDANFVDIVHVNQGEFGYPVPLGKIDFYINGGGPLQPQCGIVETIQDFFCAHNSAPHYFAKSIGTTSLIARSCPFTINRDSTVIFGENCPKTATGRYCIQLNV